MRISSLLSPLALLPAALIAQTAVPVHPLGPLMAESREAYGLVQSVRALSDGRVLVNDAVKHRVLLLDKNLGLISVVADSTPGVVNGHGDRPGALIPYPGDSTLYVDMTSQSFLVVDPSGKIARVMAAPRPNDVIFLTMGGPGLDQQNRLTYRAMTMPTLKRDDNGGFMPPELPDSAPIFRVDLSTRKVDTVASIKIPTTKLNITRSDDGRSVRATAEINPLPVLDEWALMTDGALAIVRGQDYHVDFVEPDGSRRSSPKIPYDWQRLSDSDKVVVTDSVKKALMDAQQGGVGAAMGLAGAPMAMTVTRGVGGGDGGNVAFGPRMSVSVGDAPPGRGGASGADTKGAALAQGMINMVSPSELPDYRPPFRSGAVRASLDDKLWVATTAPIATMPGSIVYDVIDRKGALVDRVALPAGRQLIGFGPGGDLYIAWRDGLGMHLGRAKIRA